MIAADDTLSIQDRLVAIQRVLRSPLYKMLSKAQKKELKATYNKLKEQDND